MITSNRPAWATEYEYHVHGKSTVRYWVWRWGDKFYWEALHECGEARTEGEAAQRARDWIKYGNGGS